MTLFLIDIPGTSLSIGDAILGTAAAIGTSYGIIKGAIDVWKLGPKQAASKFIAWFRIKRSRKKMLSTVFDQNTTILDQQKQILAELKPNGGGSLRDRLETGLQSVEHIRARVRRQDDISPTPIFEMDEDANMIYANPAFRDLIGADESEMAYKNYLSRVKDSDRTRLRDEIRLSIDNLMPIDSTVEFLYDGKGYIKIRLQATPDVRSGGLLNAFFGTASPIREGKRFLADCPMLPTDEEK